MGSEMCIRDSRCTVASCGAHHRCGNMSPASLGNVPASVHKMILRFCSAHDLIMCERWGRYWRTDELNGCDGVSLPTFVAKLRCQEHCVPTLLCHIGVFNRRWADYLQEIKDAPVTPEADDESDVAEARGAINQLPRDEYAEIVVEAGTAHHCMELALLAYDHALQKAALHAGADPNSELRETQCSLTEPIGFAIDQQPPNLAAIRTLLTYRADVAGGMSKGYQTGTWLHTAIFGGEDHGNFCGGSWNRDISKALVVQALLDGRANPMTIADYFDERISPLSAAISENNVFAIAVLCAAGATPTMDDKFKMQLTHFWPPITDLSSSQ